LDLTLQWLPQLLELLRKRAALLERTGCTASNSLKVRALALFSQVEGVEKETLLALNRINHVEVQLDASLGILAGTLGDFQPPGFPAGSCSSRNIKKLVTSRNRSRSIGLALRAIPNPSIHLYTNCSIITSESAVCARL